MSLRPERVSINPEPGAHANLFEGEVEEIIYLGEHIRTRLKLLGHDDFIVKVPNSAGHEQLRPRDPIKVGWNLADCRALDAPATHCPKAAKGAKFFGKIIIRIIAHRN